MSNCWTGLCGGNRKERNGCWTWLCCGNQKEEELPLITKGQTEEIATLAGRMITKKPKKRRVVPTPITVHNNHQKNDTPIIGGDIHFASFLIPHTPESGVIDEETHRLRESNADLIRKIAELERRLEQNIERGDNNSSPQESELQEKIKNLETTIRDLKLKKQQLRRSNTDQLERIKKLESERESISTKTFDEDPSRLGTIERSESSIQHEVSEKRYKGKTKELNSKIEYLEKQIDKLTRDLEQSSQQAIIAQKKHDQMIEQHEQTVQNLRNTCATQEEENIVLKSRLGTTSKRLAHSRRSSIVMDEREDELQKKASEIGSVEHAKEEILRLEKYAESLQERHNVDQENRDKRIEELKSEIVSLKKMLELGEVPNLLIVIERQKKKIADQSLRLHTLQSDFDRTVEQLAKIGGVDKTEIPPFQRLESSASFYSITDEAPQSDIVGEADQEEADPDKVEEFQPDEPDNL